MLPGRAKPIWLSRAARAWWRRRSWVRSSAMWLILPRVCAVPDLTVYRLSESSFGRRDGDDGRSWQDALPGAAVTAPRGVLRARSVLRLLARFAAARGIPASPAWLLDYDVIEAFCVAGLPGRAPSTRGTYRSALYELARPVHGEPGQRATPFAGAGAPAPYSPAERAELAAVAAAQRDPARRASALAVVVFGIGAGLRPGELTALRGSDVSCRGRRVMV